ncbi:band 4.1-like protein 4 [Ixodes scapularis]
MKKRNTSRGQDLLEVVHKHLNLLETAYFGLRFVDNLGQTHWLDPTKKIYKQMKGVNTFTFYFGVKFYAPDPCKLLEEITRYQFFLQVKQDIYHGRLPVAFDLAAELFALAIQSELGDYEPRRHQPGYASELRFLTNQTPELEEKVADLHRGLRGQVPATAEMNFLDKVKWLDMYGVDLHQVINDDSTYGFELPTKQSCKHLWKCCVDHHSFFRLTQSSENPIASNKFFGLGGKLRVSTRRQRGIPEGFTVQPRQQPAFTRVPSRRYQRRLGQPDGADAGTQLKEDEKQTTDHRAGSNSAHLPLLSPSTPSMYRSVSVPSALPVSTQQHPASAPVPPWEDPKQRGLYSSSTNPSPRSMRSSGSRHSHCRSSSNDGGDSKRRRHRSRRGSDNESEVSKSSRGSRTSKCSKGSSGGCRHSCHSRDSGSESDHHHHHRHKHRHHRRNRSYELVDSEAQWKEVQKQQQENTFKRPQNAVVRDLSSRKSGYVQSGMETESEALYAHRRKNRRHRSRSKSPDVKRTIPEDVKKHIERYHLVDPDALTEEEKKDIKYTKVETDSRLFKIRYSPTAGRPNYRMAKVSSSKTTRDQKGSQHDEEDGPPPPYTTVHSSPASRPSTTGAASTPQQLSEAAGSVLSYEPSPNLPRERDTFPRPLMTPPSAVNALASSASNGLVSSATRGQLSSGEPGFKSHDSRDPRIESQLSRLASRVATPPSASTDGSVPSSATNGFSSSATHGSALSAYPPNGKLPVFTSRASSTTNLLAPSTTVSGCMTTLANGGISYKSTAVRHTTPFSLNETSDLPVNGSSRLALTGIHQTPSGVRYGGCGETNGIHELSTPATNPGPRVSFQTPAVAGYSKAYSSPFSWSQRPNVGDCIPKSPAMAGCHEMSTEL